jgi:3-hydroxybutyryl-CoA dehydrogenase
MRIDELRRVLIVGAGTMGQQISLQCAMHGYDVVLYDQDAAALERARAQHALFLTGFVKAGQLAQEQVGGIQARMTATADAAAAARDVDLISESVPESPELKAAVFAQFHALCPPRTIFTTNTSSLTPSMFAAATGRPQQFAAFHFHLPVWIANVVDVMPHPGTAPEIVALLHAFARRIGQVPIHYERESPGYIFNAMLGAINREALELVVGGVASPEDVDRAWMGIMKMPIGPFGIMDSIGLETIRTITEYWARQLNDPQGLRHAEYLRTMIEQGRAGLKTGRGFYSYPRPAYQQADFVAGDVAEA